MLNIQQSPPLRRAILNSLISLLIAQQKNHLGLKPRGLHSNKHSLESVKKRAIIEAYNLLLGNCLAQVVSQSPRFLSRLVLTSS